MYTTSWCGDCRMTKMFMAEKGIGYEDRYRANPRGSGNRHEGQCGKRKVPTLDIDGRFVAVSPFNRHQLEEALGLA